VFSFEECEKHSMEFGALTRETWGIEFGVWDMRKVSLRVFNLQAQCTCGIVNTLQSYILIRRILINILR
jgi:hypothetical protein